MNNKKYLNATLRCGIYAYLISRMLNFCLEENYFFYLKNLKYKLFKDFKLWQKSLIFISISMSSYFIGMFDFKNLKLFSEFYSNDGEYMLVLVASVFVIFAFILNLIFEFLTKKISKTI